MLRTEDTEDEVDLRPLRPVLDRRKPDRGVSGEGDSECRLLGVEVWSDVGGLFCATGGNVGFDGAGPLAVAGLGLGSFGPLRELLAGLASRSGADLLALLLGDLLFRFVELNSHCFQ
jgi:hypothetical protein